MLNILLNPILYFSLAIIFLLFKHQNSFTPGASILSFKRRFLLIIFSFLVLPSILFSVFIINHVYFLDTSVHWYKKTASQLPYHLYRPHPLPPPLVQDTQYKINTTVAGKSNGVSVSYALPLKDTVAAADSIIVVLKQVQVDSNFNLDTFLSQEITPHVESEPVTLIVSSNPATIHYISDKTRKPQILRLDFITSDSIYISISSAGLDKVGLIEFANSLQ